MRKRLVGLAILAALAVPAMSHAADGEVNMTHTTRGSLKTRYL